MVVGHQAGGNNTYGGIVESEIAQVVHYAYLSDHCENMSLDNMRELLGLYSKLPGPIENIVIKIAGSNMQKFERLHNINDTNPFIKKIDTRILHEVSEQYKDIAKFMNTEHECPQYLPDLAPILSDTYVPETAAYFKFQVEDKPTRTSMKSSDKMANTELERD